VKISKATAANRDNEKLNFNQEYSYHDLKVIMDQAFFNRDLLSKSPFEMIMFLPPFMPQMGLQPPMM
jgi:hypothetical protein